MNKVTITKNMIEGIVEMTLMKVTKVINLVELNCKVAFVDERFCVN